MKNIAELHNGHTEMTSEITFLKKEVDFLLKLLRNGYSSSVNKEKIKLLDAYWKGFEENIYRMDSLLTKIKNEEKHLAGLFQENLVDIEKTLFNEDGIFSEFQQINKAIKVLKESFYEYMTGCYACSFKK